MKAPIIGITRHRLLTDGEGVTTLVAFHGCTTYQTVEERMYCYCPKCKKLLHHY